MLKLYKITGKSKEEEILISIKGSIDIDFEKLREMIPGAEPMDPHNYPIIEKAMEKALTLAIKRKEVKIIKCYPTGSSFIMSLAIGSESPILEDLTAEIKEIYEKGC